MESWFPKRYGQAQNVIQKWEKRYNEDEMRILIQAQYVLSRSPGKRKAYEEWLEAHPAPTPLAEVAE